MKLIKFIKNKIGIKASKDKYENKIERELDESELFIINLEKSINKYDNHILKKTKHKKKLLKQVPFTSGKPLNNLYRMLNSIVDVLSPIYSYNIESHIVESPIVESPIVESFVNLTISSEFNNVNEFDNSK
jgi:hypothetical protein